MLRKPFGPTSVTPSENFPRNRPAPVTYSVRYFISLSLSPFSRRRPRSLGLKTWCPSISGSTPRLSCAKARWVLCCKPVSRSDFEKCAEFYGTFSSDQFEETVLLDRGNVVNRSCSHEVNQTILGHVLQCTALLIVAVR